MKAKRGFYFTSAFLLLLLIMALSISAGAVHIPLQEILNVLLGKGDEVNRRIILTLRLPRVIESALVGMGLSVVGAFFQGLLRNPMADPYVLGISSGAAFGATIAIIMGLGIFGLSSMAFITALLTIFFVYTVSRTGSRLSMTTMLLAGIAISAFMSAIISLLMLLNHDQFSRIVFWTMGGFGLVSWPQVIYSSPLILIGSFVMYAFSRDVNVILTGEESAEHLGVNAELVKKIILILGSLVTASCVSVGGIIGFVGLIVPHISRFIVGPDNRVLVPFSALFGASFLTFADLLARVILKPVEMPIGIITATFGGPFFLYLLVRSKQKNEGM
ncbi:iron complex transport system permease protein [Caldanaerobacter subterraneus subsp. tengcongensis MB4]|uniref:ABC-type cobalamin/Fe3+-siderophores transport systems, permease components n=1 Tax=Caldanaerobacter subterraneus subsp. tengcongensis (strain DSM 15242 / JCM 11007 / NBRC 100824 / MB4) TaxID=273068 RepID=Q8RCP6_CALS4|nr:iron ABC transporter permease [Caldanaerobacter subterraneus]AAM23660.1 ABC-type cobalamin/Fe3+-siderophores transport systems, permease components [Caldanaerobacter subterraneus subsp. tengcongensis MB4]MCS3916846.1 iron complex transport system permease protein [Caldanaerobacter subterraneus subsp. tengcongensis MB4]